MPDKSSAVASWDVLRLASDDAEMAYNGINDVSENSSEHWEGDAIDTEKNGTVAVSMCGDDGTTSADFIVVSGDEGATEIVCPSAAQVLTSSPTTNSVTDDGTLGADAINDVSENTARQQKDDVIDAKEDENETLTASMREDNGTVGADATVVSGDEGATEIVFCSHSD